jgi:hypothetical protein
MWQRIQTLFLAISTILVAVLLFGDAWTFNGPDGIQALPYLKIQKPYFGILLCILAAMIVFALVSFKVRILQMRLATLSALVALGMQGWLAYLYFTAPDGIVFRWTAVFPLVISICNIFAARGCYQDQVMVESAYRIRESRKRKKK